MAWFDSLISSLRLPLAVLAATEPSVKQSTTLTLAPAMENISQTP